MVCGASASVWAARHTSTRSLRPLARALAVVIVAAWAGEYVADGAARQAAWAAGLWVRLFNAKKDAAAGGGPQLDRLSGEIARRLERAGLNI